MPGKPFERNLLANLTFEAFYRLFFLLPAVVCLYGAAQKHKHYEQYERVSPGFLRAECLVLAKRAVPGKKGPIALVDLSLQREGRSYTASNLPLQNPYARVTTQQPTACAYDPQNPGDILLVQESSRVPDEVIVLLLLATVMLLAAFLPLLRAIYRWIRPPQATQPETGMAPRRRELLPSGRKPKPRP